ncbi:MAG: Rrf2 family transcriptional regulator [Nitrosomonadales bacterium]
MRLTQYTDYSLRVLIYLAYRQDKIVTITELADFYKVSRNHLVKVVHNLGIQGYIATTRGKNGGLRLGRPAKEIVVGDVIRKMEPDFDLLECFNPVTDQCVITHSCALKSVLINARDDFLATLDQYTIADTLNRPAKESPEFKSIPVIHN